MKKLLTLLSALFFILAPSTLATTYSKSSSGVTTVNTPLPKTTNRIKEINSELASKKNRVQIAVLAVDRLHNETIEELGLETARSWKIGYEDSNYGMLFVFSKEDRKMRLETSNNMATIITDVEANHYLELVKENFRNKDYDSGTLKMINKIYEDKLLPFAKGEDVKKYSKYDETIEIIIFSVILLIIFLVVFYIINNKAKKILKKFDNNKNYIPSRLEEWILLSQTIDESDMDAPYAPYVNKRSSDYSSSSSDYSDSWSGGGFDGGGSSDSW